MMTQREASIEFLADRREFIPLLCHGLGFKEVYSGNKSPDGILVKSNWSVIRRVLHNHEKLYVYIVKQSNKHRL